MQANVHMDNKWSIFAKKNAKQMIFDKIYSKKHLSNSNDWWGINFEMVFWMGERSDPGVPGVSHISVLGLVSAQ